ncbi:MAG: DUF89 family protein [Deltaproteobacteria bacterium]|nr:DUF89 family protein [Deltaproteobacteria bacterium]
MKSEAICASCVLHDLVGALDRLGIEGEIRARVLRLSLRHLADAFDLGQPPSTHITAVHRILKRETGLAVPFAALRARCNEVGLQVAAQVAREAAALPADERFRFLARWAIAGNHLDFRTVGTGYDFPPERITAMLRQSLEAGLAVDETAAMRARCGAGTRVVYLHDNVGEIALDKLLIAEVRAAGARVTSALRGGPITSDATMEDGVAVGLGEVADAVVCAGPDTLGVSWEEMTPALRAALAAADLVITKGQANYYVLSEHAGEVKARIACLLRTKCPTVSRRFGHEGPINVAVLLTTPRR